MIEVVACGPMASVQDAGRPGHLSAGLGRGGAADGRALEEASALLGGSGAAIETAGAPLVLRVDATVTLALTGAPMVATIGGRVLGWHASHRLPGGAELRLRPVGQGVYSYVQPAGGIRIEPVMGSRSTHFAVGIGRALVTGDRLPVDADGPADASPRVLVAPEDRFDGGVLRCVPTPQTDLFPPAVLARFLATAFRRDPRGNRQGVRLTSRGPGFATAAQLSLLSDFVLPGDVQMTGEGVPHILGPESQTTGGYPRIAHVVAADLPRAMQAPQGAALWFRMVDPLEARAARPGSPRVKAARIART